MMGTPVSMKNSTPSHLQADSRVTLGRLRIGVARMFPGVALLMIALLPVLAFADEAPSPDGRLEGYNSSVTLPEPGGVGFTWFMVILLTLVVTAVMFKNAKRSHLD